MHSILATAIRWMVYFVPVSCRYAQLVVLSTVNATRPHSVGTRLYSRIKTSRLMSHAFQTCLSIQFAAIEPRVVWYRVDE